ncbi:uncharacterized protein LOC112154046 [Oryzias melastigma]|uniref:Uncharacterized LOC112154046 n=1 Tax=Oryzias melastigma TaxID=30732 RepID=A0A3B3DB49_ORYME|nr:uncharacterized protein LOC112154046 [Oryzias melastigma]
MDSQIEKTSQSLTTSADMRKTTQMLMQPNANWEEYLAPSPLSIAIMGELVFISSNTDFSINKNPPEDGFKYIKYPDSFRACLMQVCNSGWQAFNLAHKNMDQIRIHTASVPDYMKSVVKILFQGDDETVENFLPNQLKNIPTIADECVELADGVKKLYNDVISLIQELLEAIINAKHIHGEDLEKVMNKIKENEMREKSAKELDERYTKAMEAMSNQVEEAQEEYKRSMNSLPTGWDLVSTEVAETLTQTVGTMVNAVAAMASQHPATSKSGSSEMDVFNKSETVDVVSELEIYSRSSQILRQATTFLEYIDEDKINWKALYDQKTKSPKTQYTKEEFERLFKKIQKADVSKVKDKALSLCERGITICERLASYSPDQVWDKETTAELIKEVNMLHQDALKFDSKSKFKTATPAFTPKPPMVFKTRGNSGPQSTKQRAAENARFRIEQSREQLKQAGEEYSKVVERMERNKKELIDILVEMQNCKIKEIEFDTIIKLLIKGMDAMGRVKEQWEKMVRFFKMVADIVRNSLGKTLPQFLQNSENMEESTYNSKLFTKDLVYSQAFQASNIASLVHMISWTYCEVSNKYLMDSVSRLGRLMTMENETTEFKEVHKNLQDSCQKAQENILNLVQKTQKEFKKNTDTRMAQIESRLKAVLPAASPEETQRIKEIVQASITDEDTDNQ